MIEIRVPSRVAVSLIGLSDDGYRINGGVGWALDTPSLVLKAHASANLNIVDRRLTPLENSELASLLQLLKQVSAMASLTVAVTLEISGDLHPHRGQGGGTALRLAALESLFCLNNVEISRSELVQASVRGGTSGIGVRTYFDGGFVFDIGHKSSERPKPSHAWEKPNQPLNLLRLEMPLWKMGMCTPFWLPAISHEEEKAFFKSVLPVPHSDVKDVLYHIVCGTLAAVAEGDLETFAVSIDAIQRTIWKAAEWSRYGEQLTQVATELRDAGARGIGMSSLGPSLYFDATHLEPTRLAPKIRDATFITRPSNLGRMLTDSRGHI
ncbi:beta-ribofuranosylaminobenzene 5'-phosphate synthase family protein [Rhizobium rhizogenes]|uniref:beta-ribofuranosylaminobenzene 5'-phosphate synthase family protein n=1 Tax=Rhizobium rhizogenes TaxID=359 RepID=UPI0015719B2D|nr:beta-ribofuranosylaminobenzene 5'-phosphate synthase family protein [Rhizobium rhizogenes]NTF64922.1 hypothetical protein [Rhizobium rhizogenes]NTG96270.1 hypothetical protein [Rhizobium rhizogenes]